MSCSKSHTLIAYSSCSRTGRWEVGVSSQPQEHGLWGRRESERTLDPGKGWGGLEGGCQVLLPSSQPRLRLCPGLGGL